MTTPGSQARIVKTVLQVVAVAASVVAAVAVLLLPTVTRVTSDAQGLSRTETISLVQVDGTAIVIILLVPVTLTLAPLLVPATQRQPVRVVSTVLLAVFVALGALSIGAFFVPALALAVVAMLLPPWRAAPARRGG